MDKLYEYFYLTTLVSGLIGKRYKDIWRKIQYGLMVITAVAMIGFITTVGI